MSEQSYIFKVIEASLKQLADLVFRLEDEAFCAKSEEDIQGAVQGSIGEHIRHSLDHVLTLLSVALSYNQEQKTLGEKKVYYDRRERGVAMETDRQLCLKNIQVAEQQIAVIGNRLSIKEELSKELEKDFFSQKVQIEHVIDAAGHRVFFPSNLSREFAFVYHHQIHHKAIIAIRLRLMGLTVDPEFGFAPATLETIRCV